MIVAGQARLKCGFEDTNVRNMYTRLADREAYQSDLFDLL